LNKNNPPVLYFCFPPNKIKTNLNKAAVRGHTISYVRENIIVWPTKVTPSNCSPKNLYKLKQVLKSNKITVVDKIKNHNQVVMISGHINRSGESFLVGETPFKNKEQFPDMSNIYLNSTLKSISVHTVGQTRFSHETKLNKTTVWSESVGLLSPVFVYLGFFVQAYGVPERLAKKVKISEFLN
tara:strand:- start:1489 stop:2037 length:549 start_codon:yes stop_codon:yes gene_type:complete